MNALAMNEPLQMPSGVAVSNAGNPLQLVSNTRLKVISGEEEINGCMVAKPSELCAWVQMVDPGSSSREQGY